MTQEQPFEISALIQEDEQFAFTYEKERIHLLIRKQVDVHPHLVLPITKALMLLGFDVRKDAHLFIGCTGNCPVTVGLRYQDCNDIEDEH